MHGDRMKITLLSLSTVLAIGVACGKKNGGAAANAAPAPHQENNPVTSENAPVTNPQPSKPAPSGDEILDAAAKGDVARIKALIATGGNVNARGNDEAFPLLNASSFGHLDTVMALVKAKADLNLQNARGDTALLAAAFFGHADIVQALLDAGANKTIRNKSNATALDSVTGPFEEVKPVYDFINGILFIPMGKPLDYERIKRERPKIAELLR
ncbi:MAG: hypothetical protein CMO74_08305 [Verrucomicrobiales bacterium]|nr:hypothetical protein [Verrucomicrobiales bacterium]